MIVDGKKGTCHLGRGQGRQSWLTNSALINEPKCGGEGGQPMSTAVHMEPKKTLEI